MTDVKTLWRTHSRFAMQKRKFQADQLKAARRLRAKSLREVSELLLENGVALTKQALNKYENGDTIPTDETIKALADCLKLPGDYFYRSEFITLSKVEFRKLAKYSIKETEQIYEVVKLEISNYLELESLLAIDSKFERPAIDPKVSSLPEIEEYAGKLREFWGLGSTPIPNVIEMLEDNSIKLIQVDSDMALDGFSTFANDMYPVIVLNKRKLDDKQDRKRWTALHELGHILLDLDNLPQKEVERFCHYFAGAMLFPEEKFKKEIGKSRTKLSLHELGAFKQEYGISMQAIVYRAKELGVISQSYYRQFFFMFNHLGYKVEEPIAYYGKKASSRFDQLLFRALSEEVISIEKAAELKNMTIEEFKKEYPVI